MFRYSGKRHHIVIKRRGFHRKRREEQIKSSCTIWKADHSNKSPSRINLDGKIRCPVSVLQGHGFKSSTTHRPQCWADKRSIERRQKWWGMCQDRTAQTLWSCEFSQHARRNRLILQGACKNTREIGGHPIERDNSHKSPSRAGPNFVIFLLWG